MRQRIHPRKAPWPWSCFRMRHRLWLEASLHRKHVVPPCAGCCPPNVPTVKHGNGLSLPGAPQKHRVPCLSNPGHRYEMYARVCGTGESQVAPKCPSSCISPNTHRSLAQSLKKGLPSGHEGKMRSRTDANSISGRKPPANHLSSLTPERGLEESLLRRPCHGQDDSHRPRTSPVHQASGASEMSGFHTFNGQPKRIGKLQFYTFGYSRCKLLVS